MAEFQLRDFFKELFSMKKIVCISVILSVIACAGIGYYRFKRTQTGDQKEIIETYEKSMKKRTGSAEKGSQEACQRDSQAGRRA